jgi:hypothetical protein
MMVNEIINGLLTYYLIMIIPIIFIIKQLVLEISLLEFLFHEV